MQGIITLWVIESYGLCGRVVVQSYEIHKIELDQPLWSNVDADMSRIQS